MIFDEFDICYGAYKIVKHDLKHLDNICSKEILGKILICLMKSTIIEW